jgi:hypothetical protein
LSIVVQSDNNGRDSLAVERAGAVLTEGRISAIAGRSAGEDDILNREERDIGSPLLPPTRLRRAGRWVKAWPMSMPDSPQAAVLSLENSILDVLTRAGGTPGAPGTPGPPKTLSAPEIAHAINPEGDWHALLLPIRRAAVALAQAGRLVIYRKGKPADPNDFRGVYRLGLPRQD